MCVFCRVARLAQYGCKNRREEGKAAADVRVGIGGRVVEIHVPGSYLSAIVRVAAHIGDTPADEAKSSLLIASHNNHPL